MSKKKPGDAASLNINKLLKAAPSKNVAEQLVEWADATRQKIARGDMMMGILTAQEVAKIPLAYRTAAQHGDANAWIKLAWWCAFPQYGEPDVESAEDALQQAIEVKAAGAELELVKIRWFFKRQTATAAERQQAFQLASSIAA